MTGIKRSPFRISMFMLVGLVVLFSLPCTPSAQAADTELYEVLIARGIRKINAGKPDEALVLLTQAMKLSPDNPEASYYAGIAASKSGNLQAAEKLLLKTLNLDENAVESYLELGRLCALTSQCDKADEYLEKFIALTEDTASRNNAKSLMQSCREKTTGAPYTFSLVIGAQDDSNVLLESDNPPLAAKRRSDNRLITKISAGGFLFSKNRLDLKANYTFYQSFNRHLTKFNVTYQKFTPEIGFQAGDRLRLSAGYALEYIYFGSEDYGLVHTYSGKVSIEEPKHLSTEAVYEYRDHKYWDTDLFPANSIRRGHTNTLGIRQNLFTKALQGDLFYFHDWDSTTADFWDFNGFRTGAETVTHISSFYFTLSAEFNKRRYRAVFPTFTDNRIDRAQQYALGIHYFFTPKTKVSLTETFTINDSNLNPFNYKRNVAGIYFSTGFL